MAQAPPTNTPTSDPAVLPTQPGTPTATDPAQRPPTFRDREPAAPARDGQQARQSQQKVLRASQVIGTNVKNRADEDLGSINDIVFDSRDGRVTYAAVSMGGFLGVGDKLFAVPWEAIELRAVEGERVAYLDIDKQRMQNAQGFDQDNWPDMANERWREENDRFYRTQSGRRHEVAKPVQTDTRDASTQSGAQPRSAQPTTPPQPQQ